MKLIISNAFALSMLAGKYTEISVTEVDTADASSFITKYKMDEITVAVGHADTAAIFSDLLGREITANRINVTLDWDTTLLVGQYQGPRLPEGTKELPEGASIRWLIVRIIP